jgi:hypothetical protein
VRRETPMSFGTMLGKGSDCYVPQGSQRR